MSEIIVELYSNDLLIGIQLWFPSHKETFFFKLAWFFLFYYNRVNVLSISYKNYSGDENHLIYVFQFCALNWLCVPDKTIH